ncbi:hypothetical protein ABZP36_008434 [Zizania latifolia]
MTLWWGGIGLEGTYTMATEESFIPIDVYRKLPTAFPKDKKALEEKAAKKAAQSGGGSGGTSTDSKNKSDGGKK